MNNFQETDLMTFPLHTENWHSSDQDDKTDSGKYSNFNLSTSDDYEVTLGRRSGSQFRPMPDIVRPAFEALRRTKNENIATEARRFLLVTEETIIALQHFGVDLGHLPHLRVFDVDDGSTLIEWIFDDFRIGFSFETTLDESSWYLISNSNLREISASGFISGIDMKNLVFWLFSFVLLNT